MSFSPENIESSEYNKLYSNYIPFACHYDETSLLTKCGNLLRTIKISALSEKDEPKGIFNLRDQVQASLKDIADPKYSFWLHTVRRKASLEDKQERSIPFCQDLHKFWVKKNYWHDKYVNELYITIIYENLDFKQNTLEGFLKSLSYSKLIHEHQAHLKEASEKLNEVTDRLLNDLSEYEAVPLRVQKVDDTNYSDYMSFFSKIIHLDKKEIILPEADISEDLSLYKYAVGSDNIEMLGLKKKFASIISLKEYTDLSKDLVDTILQLPIDFIITEIIEIINKKEILAQFKDFKYINDISKDPELFEKNGLNKLYEIDNNLYCRHKISIMNLSNSLEQTRKELSIISTNLSKLGIVHIKEDINLEASFWSQLPGNYTFIKNFSFTTINNIAGFASLQSFPVGKKNNPWGKYISIFRSEFQTPYFFNFHNDESGLTGIIGPKGGGKTVFTNFLLAESSKYSPNILYISEDNSSNNFLKIFGGQEISEIPNPFIFKDKNFLQNILALLGNHPNYSKLKEEEKKDINAIIKNLNKDPEYDIEKLFKDSKKILKSFVDYELPNISWFHLKDQFNPLTLYILLYNFIKKGAGKPQIIVLDEVLLPILQNEFFAEELFSLISLGQKHNTIFIYNLDIYVDSKKLIENTLCKKIIEITETQIFLPYGNIDKKFQTIFSLSDKQFNKLINLDPIFRKFLINTNNECLEAELNLFGAPEYLKVLSNAKDS